MAGKVRWSELIPGFYWIRKGMGLFERTGLDPGECLCAAAGLVGVIVVLWLMSSPGAPPQPHHPMRLRGPWPEGNIT